jgi:hypothetical protein
MGNGGSAHLDPDRTHLMAELRKRGVFKRARLIWAVRRGRSVRTEDRELALAYSRQLRRALEDPRRSHVVALAQSAPVVAVLGAVAWAVLGQHGNTSWFFAVLAALLFLAYPLGVLRLRRTLDRVRRAEALHRASR